MCVMVDQDWEPSEKANKNSRWKIDIVKANKLFSGITGYEYTEDFQSRLVATFGSGYLEPGTVIADLLDEETPAVLKGFQEASGQITMDEIQLKKEEKERA